MHGHQHIDSVAVRSDTIVTKSGPIWQTKVPETRQASLIACERGLPVVVMSTDRV